MPRPSTQLHSSWDSPTSTASMRTHRPRAHSPRRPLYRWLREHHLLRSQNPERHHCIQLSCFLLSRASGRSGDRHVHLRPGLRGLGPVCARRISSIRRMDVGTHGPGARIADARHNRLDASGRSAAAERLVAVTRDQPDDGHDRARSEPGWMSLIPFAVATTAERARFEDRERAWEGVGAGLWLALRLRDRCRPPACRERDRPLEVPRELEGRCPGGGRKTQSRTWNLRLNFLYAPGERAALSPRASRPTPSSSAVPGSGIGTTAREVA